MQIFEKIIEKLQECERQAEKGMGFSEKYAEANAYGGEMIAFEKAIEIVKQVAADYNNGWIPVTERLPEENEDVEVTIEETADEVGGKRYYNVRSWLQDGQWVIKKNPYHPTVIAWKYPTEPYNLPSAKYRQEGEEIDYKQTNADRIRSMCDEELADFLMDVGMGSLFDKKIMNVKAWLQLEAEE